MRFAAFMMLAFAAMSAQAAQCAAQSGPGTAALVELYTSEGCSSCPPADRWLASLGGYPRDRVVPLALHVDYWDYIGWKDPYAKREFSLRQRKLSQLQRLALVYTPQVLLQGRDFRGWGTKAFDEAVVRINREPERARIRLAILAADGQSLEVEASARLVDPARAQDLGLYLAAYESKLESRVAAGENRGRVLAHDYVVLEWQGPFSFGGDARLTERRKLLLLPKAVAANSGVVGFVQNRRTGEVLQALLRSTC